MASRPLLAEPQQAIYDYLDALLREIPETVEAPPEVAVAAADVDAELQDWDPELLAAAVPAVAEPVLAEVESVLAEPAAPVQPEVAQPESRSGSAFRRTSYDVAAPLEDVRLKADPLREAAVESAAEPEGPPAWARPDFQALLFDVGGLTLAVPLVKLHSVVPWTEQTVTPMPRQPDWCHGLMRYRDLNVRVVDTAALVLPAGKRPPPEEPPRQILVVGDGRWALSCRALGEVIRLDADAVKWRTQQGKRPWLAGTVREQLCALLDTEAFAAMLADKH